MLDVATSETITRPQAEALATTARTLASLLAGSGESALQLVFAVGAGQQLVLRAYTGDVAQAIVEEGRPPSAAAH